MRNLPPLLAIRAFEAAARHGSFTRAAAELAMTQAGVSYQVRLLEDRIGTPLFVRRARDVVLTDAGRRLAAASAQALDGLSAAYTSVRDEGEGVLRITALHSFASNWLAPRLGRFQLAHPEVAVRLDVSDGLADLAAGEADIGIRGREASGDAWPGLVCHRLFRWRFTPMCSPDFLARWGPIASPEDLLRVPLLSPEDPWWARWFDLVGIDAGRRPARSGFGTHLQQLQGSAAVAGQGVAVLSPIFWSTELASGSLVRLFPEVGGTEGGMWLVAHPDRAATRKIRIFRDWLLAELRQARAADSEGIYGVDDGEDVGPVAGAARA